MRKRIISQLLTVLLMAMAYSLLESTSVGMKELLFCLMAMISLSLLSVIIYVIRDRKPVNSKVQKATAI